MSDENPEDQDESTVRKDLDEIDETDGDDEGHYSREDVAEACHAEEGQSHE